MQMRDASKKEITQTAVKTETPIWDQWVKDHKAIQTKCRVTQICDQVAQEVQAKWEALVVKGECRAIQICDQVVQVAQEVQDQVRVETQVDNQEVIQTFAQVDQVETQADNQEVIQTFAQVDQVVNQVDNQLDNQEATRTCGQVDQVVNQEATRVTCLATLCRSEQTIESDGLYENN